MSKEIIKKKLLHLLPFAIFMVGYLIWFEIIDQIPRTNPVVIGWPIDLKIPFLEGFVVPYFSWFIFLPFGILLLLAQDEDAYDKLVTFLMIGMLTFLLVSTFLPNRLELRPETLPRNNIFTAMCQALWKIDSPENVWPSIHVFDTAAVALMLLLSHASWMKKMRVKIVIVLWALSIIIGTVFIKQHSLFDHLTAWIMLAVLSVIILKCGCVIRLKFNPKKAKES